MKNQMTRKSNPFLLVGLTLALVFTGACKKDTLKTDLFSDDPAVRMRSLGKLSEVGEDRQKELIPDLMGFIDSKDSRVAERAENALEVIGPLALPDLSQALSNPNPYIRLSVTEMIGKIGFDTPGVVQALAKAMQDSHPLVREAAGLALGRSKETMGLLILALDDKDKEIRETAARVLKLLDSPEASEALKKHHLLS